MKKWTVAHAAQMSSCAMALSCDSALSFFAMNAVRFMYALRVFYDFFSMADTSSERQPVS